jgi:acyl-[acyl-carrier-protein]-phospholipid O-acyltransferase / long-chain-fatty-acid--[acyl-carrier-protein] ligase
MFETLLRSRRFAPLFWCQFCSALNDNFLKNALAMLILFGLGGAASGLQAKAGVLVTLAGVVFIAPFFLLSAIGGEIADRFDKARIARAIRLAEIPIAALAAIGFLLHSVLLLFLTLGLFGMVAALFGPVKYGILPEKLDTAELAAGNALVEGATFLAILTGTIAGGVAVAETESGLAVALIVALLALTSWGLAQLIPEAGPAAPLLVINFNPWTSTLALLRELKADRRLWGGAHIVSWFWVVGFVSLSLLPTLIKEGIGGSEGVVTYCLSVFTVGIAVGSLVAARASRGRPNLALVPIGALLIGAFALLAAWLSSTVVPDGASIGPWAFAASRNGVLVTVALGGLAIAGGLFVVPAFAAVQAWAPVDRRARVVAAVNVLNAAYMLVGGAVVALLQSAGISLSMLFAALGLLSLAYIPIVLRAWDRDVRQDLARTFARLAPSR